MKKILFIMNSLAGGGAEKVLVNLVNHMDISQYDISVLTLFEDGVNAPNLRPEVKHEKRYFRCFKGLQYIMRFLPKRLLFKHYVGCHDYDLVVAYMTGIPTFVAAGSKSKKIAWLHGEFHYSSKFNWRLFVHDVALKRCYDRFNAIVGVSNYVCDGFNRAIHSKVEAKTIFNTNDCKYIEKQSVTSLDCIKPENTCIISTVGRLDSTKGYDRLLNVCRKLVKLNVKFQIWILGDGVMRHTLEQNIQEWGLQDIVKLFGYQKNPYNYMKESDLFVCSSRTEGLSTVVSEALILGLPVVSTEVSGARELLGENNEYGLVVENSEQGIYDGLKAMLTDEKLRLHYKQKAIERAPFFSTERTVKQVEDLIDKVLQD